MILQMLLVLGGWILLCIPSFIIMRAFKLDVLESLLLSFFATFGFTAYCIYFLGKMVGLSYALIMTILLFYLIMLFVKIKFKNKIGAE